jgi:hypothetical protein
MAQQNLPAFQQDACGTTRRTCAALQGGQQAQQAQRANLDMLASLEGWEQLLLDVMRHSVQSTQSTRSTQFTAGQQAALSTPSSAELAYRLLLHLLCHSVQSVPGGASHLAVLAALLKAQPGVRYKVPIEKCTGAALGAGGQGGSGWPGAPAPTVGASEGASAWELLHDVLADVMGALLEAQSGEWPLGEGERACTESSRIGLRAFC